MTVVLEYLENTVKATPEKNAFVGENGGLTFAELYEKSRAVGSFLHERGVYKKPVVVFMEKSADMVAAFLGVAYGGCYYVPLDAEMPTYRIRQIFEAVSPSLVIRDDASQQILATLEVPCDILSFADISTCRINDPALATLRQAAIDTDPLYVVFTSGSTGTPKGVTASHRSVIDYIEQLCPVLGVDETTVFGNQSPLYLDACLKELIPTLKYGATTHFIPKSLFMFPVKLIQYINAHGINTICWVASALGLVAALGALDKATPHTLRTIAFGSEVFAIKHLNRWRKALPQARFIHLYGPTEATGMSLYYILERDFAEHETVPIGRPFPNTGVLLLDENGDEPPSGEAGEICIRGTCLCLGYFNDPARTQAAFVQNPHAPFLDLLYKTGDLGRRGADSLYYFLSRKDHQIKHMGYRIELTEIEWVATRIPGVQLACAVFDDDASRIILYYMAEAGTEKSAVQAALKAELPRYMQPHALFPLDSLPQTTGGKIDRVTLLTRYKESKVK
ncbi:MAG: amino acid adenylation domain-containing protein [Defluviitaleaceae bacterium]|nr:amino acid adenylation domain-containing protein [Defluviitaleaceae bacterium]MCL2239913.1 amino acid adenylation domain-containing protein [Defluviitaleaceae bacterium]